VSSLTVAAYVTLGGLYSAIFNEVLQFFLIWVGVLTVPVLGLIEAGGWHGLVLKIHERLQSDEYVHLWSTLGTFSGNPMGVNWAGIVLGLGGVIAFGYWGTDFLVIQRAMAAKDLRSAACSYHCCLLQDDGSSYRHSSRPARPRAFALPTGSRR
jgi:SSS family solute:Na+ symporter